jgi:hypothetical protein
VEAYVEAINVMLAESQWAGAADAAGGRPKAAGDKSQPGAEFDEDAARHDTSAWFER